MGQGAVHRGIGTVVDPCGNPGHCGASSDLFSRAAGRYCRLPPENLEGDRARLPGSIGSSLGWRGALARLLGHGTAEAFVLRCLVSCSTSTTHRGRPREQLSTVIGRQHPMTRHYAIMFASIGLCTSGIDSASERRASTSSCDAATLPRCFVISVCFLLLRIFELEAEFGSFVPCISMCEGSDIKSEHGGGRG